MIFALKAIASINQRNVCVLSSYLIYGRKRSLPPQALGNLFLFNFICNPLEIYSEAYLKDLQNMYWEPYAFHHVCKYCLSIYTVDRVRERERERKKKRERERRKKLGLSELPATIDHHKRHPLPSLAAPFYNHHWPKIRKEEVPSCSNSQLHFSFLSASFLSFNLTLYYI